MEEVGIREIPGPKHHSRIVQYFASCDVSAQFKSDETPWCSAFINWCLRESGLPITGSPLARSWMTVGKQVYDGTLHPIADDSRIEEGDICVFFKRNSSYQGHVGLFIAWNKKKTKILVLGGNQNNSVCYQWYPVKGKQLYLKSIRRV